MQGITCRVLGLEIVAGRAFTGQDVADATPVAVVSENVAKLVASEGPAVGRALTIQRNRWSGEPTVPERTVTIVGVAADTDTGALGQRDGGVIYLPFAQHYEPRMVLVARAFDPAPLPARLRRVTSRLIRTPRCCRLSPDSS